MAEIFGKDSHRESGWAVAFGVLALLILFSPSAFAQELVGQPPVRQFKPSLEIYPQNNAVAQGADGVVYVGSQEGVLSFDGARWTHQPMPNREFVRSLEFDGKERIYVGGYDCFGYLETDATGARRFVDLTPKALAAGATPQFADIWDIAITPEYVVFRAVKDVFLYSPETGELQAWHSDDRYGAVIWFGDELIMQWRGQGLKRFTGSDWELVSGTEMLTDLIYELYPLPQGGLLGFDSNDRWVRVNDGTVSDFVMPDGFPAASRIAAGVVLDNDQIALSTVDGWVYILDTVKSEFRQFEIGSDYLADIIPALDGGILVIDNLALSHVGWPTDWTTLGSSVGLAGSLYDVVEWNDRWHVLGGAGVYRSELQDGKLRFVHQDWARHEAWDLHALSGDAALLAESYELKLVENESSRALTHANFYPRVIQPASTPDLFYIGTELGIGILQGNADHWTLLLDADDMDNLRVLSIVEVDPHRVLLGSERGGIRLIEFADDYSGIAREYVHGETDGIDYGDGPADIMRLPDGRIIATTSSGLFEWRDGLFHATDLDGLEPLRRDGEWLRLVADGNGRLWAYSHLRLLHRDNDEPWLEANTGGLRRGVIESVRTAGDEGVIVVARAGLLNYSPHEGFVSLSPPKVRLRSVELVNPDGSRDRLSLDREQLIELPQGEFGVVFSYSLADFRNPADEIYQARLLGFEDNFSAPSATNRFTYSRLSPGHYRFEVRARDSNGRISTIKPFEFVVRPPWYTATTIQVLAGILFLGLVVAGTLLYERGRTRRLEAEGERLRGMVAARTTELEEANRKLETMAHLDGLTGIPNRRRLDTYLDTVWSQGVERGRALSLLVIDVDHFKRFNDEHGHLAGDRLLKRLATTLSRCLRRTEDLVARYGGEEFLVVLPGAEIGAAKELAQSMREQVEISSLGATISIGIASDVPRAGRSVQEMVQIADKALYEAKAAGRNCVRVGEH